MSTYEVLIPDLPKIAFRLTINEINWMMTGLRPVIYAYAGAQEFGKLPFTDLFRIRPDLRLREGKFDPHLMDELLQVWSVFGKWSETSAKTHRIHLDALQLEALAFSTRVAGTQVRHGHFPPPCRNWMRTSARLLRKLEKLRKRAVRRWRTSESWSAYSEVQARWHGFSDWLRGSALYCRCNRPPLFSLRHSRKIALDRCEHIARQLIQGQGLTMPVDRELRKLVRTFVRYARRARFGVGFRAIAAENRAFHYVLGRFLKNRLGKQERINRTGGMK